MGQSLSAIQRLRSLPAVFRAVDLQWVFGWSASMAAVYLCRWNRAGLTRPLGGRSRVYFNLIVAPEWQRWVDQALEMALPGVLEIGAGVLHRQGITPQPAYRRDLCVPASGRKYSLPNFQILTRSLHWYGLMQSHVVRPQRLSLQPLSIARLSVPAALADMLTSKDKHLWLPDPDDLDLDLLNEEELRVLADLIARLGHGTLPAWDESLSAENNYERIWRVARARVTVQPSEGS